MATDSRKAKWVGLTGGLAAGKSEAAQYFREQNIPVINLDHLGQRVSQTPLVAAFLHHNFGTTDRKQLQQLIFQSEEKRKKLESYLHPLIWREFEREARELEEKGHRLIVCEAALLIEFKLDVYCDQLVVVVASEAVRRERAAKRDGMDADLFTAITRQQVTDTEREAQADVVIINDGHRDHLIAQLKPLVATWLPPAAK